MDISNLKSLISPRINSRSKHKLLFMENQKENFPKINIDQPKEQFYKSSSRKILQPIQKSNINHYIKDLQYNIKNECKRIEQKIKNVQQRMASKQKQNIYLNNSNNYKSCQNLKKLNTNSVYEKLLTKNPSALIKSEYLNLKLQQSTRPKNRSLRETPKQQLNKKQPKCTNLLIKTQLPDCMSNKIISKFFNQPQTTINSYKNLEQRHKLLKNLFQNKKKSGIMINQKINEPLSNHYETNISNRRQKIEKFSIKNFQIIKKLGKGRFGNVYLAQQKITKFIVAIKMIQKKLLKENQMIEQLKQQIKIQSCLNHPNILKMYGYFHDHQNIYLILEVSQCGNLFKILRQQKRFSQKKSAIILKQVCQSLLKLHNKGVIHRDIKPQNILINNDVIKLSDFGWSIYSPEHQRQTFCGTLDYVSPEIVVGKTYDFMVDVWSIGVLCYELITGHAPFQNQGGKQQDTYEKILKLQIKYPEFVTKEAKDFISKLLVKNPKKRMSLQETLKHNWLLQNTKGAFTLNRQIYNSYMNIN